MNEWPGEDRRTPRQAELVSMLIEVRGVAETAREALREFNSERRVWQAAQADATAQRAMLAEKMDALGKQIGPLVEIRHRLNALGWVATSALAMAVAVGGFFVWMKTHMPNFFAGGRP